MTDKRVSRKVYSRLPSRPSAQRGAVLLTGLVLLLVVTLFGVSGMQTITLDERIVSNMQSATIAFHGAESALSTCETNLQAEAGTVFRYGSFPANWRDDASFWTGAGETAPFVTQVAEAPRCVAEYIGDGGDSAELTYDPTNSASSRPVYRVTATSKGADVSTEAILESVFICTGGCFAESDVTQYAAGP